MSVRIVRRPSKDDHDPTRVLTPAWHPLRPHPVQSRLFHAEQRFSVVVAGRGSGKTDCARRKVVSCLVEPGLYFYALPTYSQARRVAWRELKRLVPKWWFASPPNESEMVIRTIFGSELYVIGMDKPQRFEGNQYKGGVLDESSDQKSSVFDLTVRPALTHELGWCWRIGVPKRFGSGAKEFRDAYLSARTLVTPHGVEVREDGDPDVAAYTWPSADILPPEEIESARRQLDAKDFNEAFDASWETVSGQIFYAFRREREPHGNLSDRAAYYPSQPILVGQDFNVDPMAWVLCHRVENKLIQFDEVWLRDTNTQAALDYLYGRYGKHDAGWVFVGDAASRQRRTSASASDYIQIANDSRFKNKIVRFPSSNPRLVDRFAATNAVMCNAAGQRRYLVNPRCTHTIDDLTARAFVPGTRDPADSGDVGHITDGLGYLIWAYFPLVVVQPDEGTAPGIEVW